MTVVADLIEKSFFEAGLTTELQHATPTQTRNAMDTLANLVKFLYGGVAGEYFTQWPLGNYGRSANSRPIDNTQVDHYPPINSMLVAVNEQAITVHLPVEPSDGARIGVIDPFNRLATYPVTIDGNGRAIGGAAQAVVNTNGSAPIWFFRADLGNWVLITPLLITDEMPFPEEYDQMFILMMAMRLNPAYGRNISSVQAGWLKEFRQQFTARYVQSAPLQINPEVSFTSHQSYDTFQDYWNGGGTQDAFNRGWGWW